MAEPAGFTKGYEASTPAEAEAPDYPGNQVWNGIGGSAKAYKAQWKEAPPLFREGEGDV
jgi:hypothetical protein